MDEQGIQLLEDLLCQQIMFYDDLVHYLHKEREALIHIDLDGLWGISEKKEEVCRKLKSIQDEISSLVKPMLAQGSHALEDIGGLMPGKSRVVFHKLYITLAGLEREVQTLRQENMTFVKDSLRFLDDMISIITGEGNLDRIYNNRCEIYKSGKTIFLSKEA
jgi:hypothetical protein